MLHQRTATLAVLPGFVADEQNFCLYSLVVSRSLRIDTKNNRDFDNKRLVGIIGFMQLQYLFSEKCCLGSANEQGKWADWIEGSL